MSNLQQKDKAYVANTYARFPVEIVSGKGSLVYDENGKRPSVGAEGRKK